jgi:hypothetical protein
MAKTVNELLIELQRVSYSLTSGDIPLTINGEKVEVVPELKGEDGDYWCELDIKEGGKDED